MNRFLVVSIHLSCWGLLWLSCYPGLISELLSFLFIIFWPFRNYPLILITVLSVSMIIWWQSQRTRRRLKKIDSSSSTRSQRYFQLLRIATIPMILIVILAILTNLPQQIALRLSLPAFEAVMAEPANSERNCKNKQLGLYHISSCYGEKDSGWYFHTPAVISPYNYGFAYKRRDESFCSSSPLPPATYYPIFGDWASFDTNCW
jgi:hypothetical protein